jgi:hypothetical protein
MRDTVIVSSDRIALVREALAAALRGQGPAVAVVAPGTDTSWVPAEVDDDTAVLIETSGSSSAPKRLALSAAALMANARASLGRLGGSGTWILALPVHFIGGLQVLIRSLEADTEPLVLTRESFNTAALIDVLLFPVDASAPGAASPQALASALVLQARNGTSQLARAGAHVFMSQRHCASPAVTASRSTCAATRRHLPHASHWIQRTSSTSAEEEEEEA